MFDWLQIKTLKFFTMLYLGLEVGSNILEQEFLKPFQAKISHHLDFRSGV